MRERLLWVQERIGAAARRAGRDPGGVEIVAVTKGFPATVAVAAISGGLSALGENRVQEGRLKRPEVEALLAAEPDLPHPVWHLIGHLQRNKVRPALESFDSIDAVDSFELASDLSRRLAAAGRRVAVLVEIKTAPEPAKHGLTLEQALDWVPRIGVLPGLDVRGLMTMAPIAAPARPSFRSLRELRERLTAGWPGPPPRLPELSMGMSGDFEAAVEEGATQLRLGRALFGPRPGEPEQGLAGWIGGAR